MQLYFETKLLIKLFIICYFKVKFINKSLKDEFVLKHDNFTIKQIYFCNFKLFTIYIFLYHLIFIF